MFDETVASVQLDLMVARANVNARLKSVVSQLETMEKSHQRGLDSSADDQHRMRVIEIERELTELRRIQQEIVEASVKGMFEMSCMLHREQEQLAAVSERGEANLEKYMKILQEMK